MAPTTTAPVLVLFVSFAVYHEIHTVHDEHSAWTSTSDDSCGVAQGTIDFEPSKMSCGPDENDLVRLRFGEDTAVVHLFGATILSWKTGSEQTENLYLSTSAVYDNKKAIRGGIPFVFPNFGPWSLGPQHGFARTSIWSLVEKKSHQAVFRLVETEATLAMWPFKFEVTYTVELSTDALHMKVDVLNTDQKPWDFTLLLHSYLKLSDIATTSISGLEDTFYIDKIHGKNSSHTGDLQVDAAIDRVYCSARDELKVSDGLRTVIVEKNGFPEAVVWNPWIDGCAKTGDLDDDAWKQMVCVEPGKVQERVVLQAGGLFIAKASLRLTK